MSFQHKTRKRIINLEENEVDETLTMNKSWNEQNGENCQKRKVNTSENYKNNKEHTILPTLTI